MNDMYTITSDCLSDVLQERLENLQCEEMDVEFSMDLKDVFMNGTPDLTDLIFEG